ncbi:hypothetical protein MAPG_05287 [Magnaporthiopsis poae ATCC 64411]|uniref:Uncharacterized protein n=1 Tax=Magnaporthiopsis poae (strain ATCC 64411 / 73-15) TaxID=644358 RepID=A0A0C4DZ00_MAGP6|nr:hypothetical protein MAPG_05287 [Magnaporthiopsis poae ATCC 64411]
MKFLVAVLALTGAAIAAPAAGGELKFFKNVEACGCQNAKGERQIGDQCNFFGQYRTKVEPSKFANLCYPLSEQHLREPMSKLITDEVCSKLYFPGGTGSYPKAVCETVRLCTFKGTYQLCDSNEPAKPPLGN